jgi:predicted nuclease with RNAse H fold
MRFGAGNNTNDNVFYASWLDSGAKARMTSADYTLPPEAWKALRANNKLYYRVGTTSVPTQIAGTTTLSPRGMEIQRQRRQRF